MLLVNGIQNTIRISLAAACLGVIIGFLLAVCSLSKNKFLNGIHRTYTDIIRGTPSVTQLTAPPSSVTAVSIRWTPPTAGRP